MRTGWVVFVAVALLVVAFGAWVRLAPSDPARWHVGVVGDADRDMAGGVLRILPGRAGDLAALDAIIRTTPRTQVLAGSVAEGHVTYVTRSALWGFPDYTTVQARGADLAIHARLRFGQSDLGVNRARVSGWLAELG